MTTTVERRSLLGCDATDWHAIQRSTMAPWRWAPIRLSLALSALVGMVAGIVWGRVRRESITTSLAGPAIYRSGAACLLLRDGNDNAHAYPLDPINRND